jgi:hypothetical protein
VDKVGLQSQRKLLGIGPPVTDEHPSPGCGRRLRGQGRSVLLRWWRRRLGGRCRTLPGRTRVRTGVDEPDPVLVPGKVIEDELLLHLLVELGIPSQQANESPVGGPAVLPKEVEDDTLVLFEVHELLPVCPVRTREQQPVYGDPSAMSR